MLLQSARRVVAVAVLRERALPPDHKRLLARPHPAGEQGSPESGGREEGPTVSL